MRNFKKLSSWLQVTSLALAATVTVAQTAPGAKPASAQEQLLPTGMSITPHAVPGVQIQPLNPGLAAMPEFTADHPISAALSPDGHTLLVLTSGYNKNFDVKAKGIPGLSDEYVFVYDVSERLPVKQQVLHVPNAYVGLAWSPDGQRFYVSGGQDDTIHVFERHEPAAVTEDREGPPPAGASQLWVDSTPAIALGHVHGLGFNDSETAKDKFTKPLPAGLAVSHNGKQLVVANSMNDSISLIDVPAKKVVAELDLRPGKINPANKGVPGGEYPYGVAFKGNNKVYVSSLRDREIVVIEIHGGVPAVTARIKTRGQPAKMVMNKAQSLLFAVADNSDSVVVVDTAKDEVAAEIKTLAPASLASAVGDFKGANPTSLALSHDEKTLYVTNGGTNAVAVIRMERDPDDSQVMGLIPTGWYPTSVTVSGDGKWIYVSNAKSPAGPNPGACRDNFIREGDRPCALKQQFIMQLEKGSLEAMPVPSAGELSRLTEQVARNNHFEAKRNTQAEKELFSGLRSKIQHVIYIVKENRTYDQVLGDLGRGNGDPKLNLFPDAMTPNHHALAREFVTLDNFYDSGEVSGLGWNWSTAARATDFTERNIPIDYAQKGVGYDVEGVNRGINVAANSSQARTRNGPLDADDLPGPADVAAPDGPEDEAGAGYLWDAVLRAKKTLRNYGFFVDLAHYSATKEGGPPLPLVREPARIYTQVAFPTKQALQQVTDFYFRGFDMRFPDFWRFKEWEREFDEYTRNDNLPSLELLRLPHDHFGNFAEAVDGVNTVETMMADNDYAIALVAEKIARSKYAGSTLIFIIEDDAQNGPDHVDAHRSVAYVIGPYVKHGAVVSQNYNTVSVLRTIEEVLGLPPLGLNDAVQAPMTDVFDLQQATWSYKARVPDVLRSTKLPLPGGKSHAAQPTRNVEYWAEKTRSFDFSVEDHIDSAAFNQVLWEGLRGDMPSTQSPAASH